MSVAFLLILMNINMIADFPTVIIQVKKDAPYARL